MSDYVKKKILVIEDEIDIAEILQFNLEKEGYNVSLSETGEEGLELIKKLKPDLVLLDLMLPGLDGLEVCKKVRQNADLADVRIIMLTAKSEEIDIVTGLELGADDYMTKPFSPRVLLSRIKNILRRYDASAVEDVKPSDNSLKIHNMALDLKKMSVNIGDENVELTNSEFKTLYFLAKHPGWIYTRFQIMDAVHGAGYPATDRAIDVMIVSLRKKLGEGANLIETVRGVGYRFKDK